MNIVDHNKKVITEMLGQLKLPSLGDSSKVYDVKLTEPEINTIHAVYAFLKAMHGVAEQPSERWWRHYSIMLEQLSMRLKEFDD